jgi:hypothetical protein
MSLEQAFQSIFAGNPAAHYTWKPGVYAAIDRGITEDDVARHLRGEEPGLLSIPVLANGLCHFAAGDCDRHSEADPPLDHAAVAREITRLGLPLIVTKSKNTKSGHIWLLFKEKDGFDCATARLLIEHYMRLLKIEYEIETFPKQEELKPGQKGSGINLCYFGGERHGFGKDGEELDLEGFIALVRERQAFGKILKDRDLADIPSGRSASKADRLWTMSAIRETHEKNVEALAASNESGHWDITLNTCAFFGGKAFAAGAFEGTDETSIKAAIRAAADAWSGREASTVAEKLSRCWDQGIAQPLKIKPEITDPKDIKTGLDAFLFFQDNFFICEDFGGHFRVMWLEPDPNFKNRRVLGHQTQEEFEKRYTHLKVEEVSIDEDGKEKTDYVPILDYWLRSRERRQYQNVVFAPGKDLGSRYLNLWDGFAIKPVAGSCDLFKAHLHHVICASNPTLSGWAIKQLAYWVQHPGEPGHVAFVFKGGKGFGKNSFVEYFGEMWGEHFLTISSGEHLGGRFNKHFLNCSVLHANESFYAGNRAHESAMKVLITDSMLTIEPKGVDIFQIPNALHLMISSNRPWVVPATVDERRFAVFNLSDAHVKDFPYFEALHNEKENGGKEALLDFLLNMDLTGFNPRNPPVTVGLREQIGHSLEGAEAFWHEVLMLGVLPNMLTDGVGQPLYENRRVKTYELIDWARSKNMAGSKQLSGQSLGLLLTSNPNGKKPPMGFKIVRPVSAFTKNPERFLSIPSLKECRDLWDTLRFKETWADPEAEWESVSFVQRRAA